MASKARRSSMPRTVAPARRLSGDIARRAFDAAAELDRAASLVGVEQAFDAHVRRLGFGSFVLLAHDRSATRLVLGAPHPHWWSHILAHGYEREGEPLVAARSQMGPVFYSEAVRRAGPTPLLDRISNERVSFGIVDGFTNSFARADGSHLTVAMCGADLETENPDIRAAAQLLSTYLALSARRLMPDGGALPVQARLTDRQRDCLRWVREGKSASDIGDILGLSAYTVDEHVKQACSRLGVRTRVQAVASAIAQGLIDA